MLFLLIILLLFCNNAYCSHRIKLDSSFGSRFDPDWNVESCTSEGATIGYRRTSWMKMDNYKAYFDPYIYVSYNLKGYLVGWKCTRHSMRLFRPGQCYYVSASSHVKAKRRLIGLNVAGDSMCYTTPSDCAIQKMAICAYTTTDCSTTWTDTLVKCLPIPPAPPIPPTCAGVKEAIRPKLIYVNNSNNHYFNNMVKIYGGVGIKNCKNSSNASANKIITLDRSCPSGWTEEAANAPFIDRIVTIVPTVGSGASVKHKETVVYSSFSHEITFDLTDENICATDKVSSIVISLGCIKRVPMKKPSVSFKAPTSSSALPKLTVTAAEDSSKTIDVAPIKGEDSTNAADFYGNKLFAFRISNTNLMQVSNLPCTSDSCDPNFFNYQLQNTCRRSSGSEYTFKFDSSATKEDFCPKDTKFVRSTLKGKNCRSSNVFHSTIATNKMCKNEVNDGNVNAKANPVQDEQAGTKICLGGWEPANAKKYYIDSTAVSTTDFLLRPIDISTNVFGHTYSSNTVFNLYSLNQYILDSMLDAGGILYFARNTTDTYEKFVFEQKSEINGDEKTELFDNSGNAVYVGANQQSKSFSAYGYGLCADIPSSYRNRAHP